MFRSKRIFDSKTSDARSNIIVGPAKYNTDPIKALKLPNSLVPSATCFHGTERLCSLVYRF